MSIMAHPLLERAAKHTAQARAINDEFEGKDMPAEAARQMKSHLEKASDYRSRVTREAELKASEEWLAEPQYKHDMTGDSAGASSIIDGYKGEYLESEKRERQEKAFFEYLRKGDGMPYELKSDLVEDSNGLKLIPSDFAGTIIKDLPNDTVMRGLATVRPTTKAQVDVGNVVINKASWGKLETGDTAADGLGSAPGLDSIKVWDLNALVKIGKDELADSDEDLATLIQAALSAEIAVQEDEAFASGTGDGDKMPSGFANGSTVTQVVTATTPLTYTSDDIISLKYAVPQAARKNASWVGNTDAEQAVQLLKDGNSHYLWQESLSQDRPSTLVGRPWFTNDGLKSGTTGTPDVAGKPLFFGDFRLGYMIADRRQLGVTRLVERYADEGKVGFMFTHRVGGGVIRPKALAYYAV